MENLESESLIYTIVKEFLTDLEQKIEGGNDETIKMVELKKVE